jgi:PAS domain S-box-containing protein
MKRSYKMIVIVLIIGSITALLAPLMSISHIYQEAQNQARIDMDRRIKTFWEFVKQKGNQFSIVDNQLLVGSYVINGNHELPDKIQQIFGGTATIFMGDTRVSTNVLQDDGSRAVGTRLDGDVYDAIFTKGSPYRGEAVILGKPYFTAYDPIRNPRGETIGVLYVGVKKSVFLTRYDELRNGITVIILSVVLIFSVMYFLLIKSGKRAELIQLQQQAILDNIPDIVWLKDRESRFIAVNAAFGKACGLSPAALVGKTDLDIWPGDLAEMYRTDDITVMESRSQKCLEELLLDQTGVRKWIETLKMPVLDDNGQIIGTTGISRDINSRKQAEKALQESELKYRDLVEKANSIILRMDTNGRITFFNEFAQRFFGYSETEIIGHHVIGSIVPDSDPNQQQLAEMVANICKNPAKFALNENENMKRSRERVFISWANKACFDEHGALVEILCVGQDVTERKRLQEVMVETEKMMTVGGLAAGMAHELNNPLGAILQNAQNIIRRVSPGLPANEETAAGIGIEFPKVREYLSKRGILDMLQYIDDSVNRAADTVAKLLTLSRKGAATIQMATLQEVSDKALELAACDYDLKKKYDFRNINIVREYATDLPPIPMNPGEIEQVLLNLLKNASQALVELTPGKTPQIIVRTRHDENFAVLELEDNGPGIPGNLRNRVFEPFFTTKEVGIGTGLGLSVSYSIIVNNHNGHISFESAPGEGTRFTIKLPLAV